MGYRAVSRETPTFGGPDQGLRACYRLSTSSASPSVVFESTGLPAFRSRSFWASRMASTALAVRTALREFFL